VKSVRVVQASEETAASFGLEKSLSVNARALGPRVGSDVQRIIKESKAGNWQLVGSTVVVDGTELIEGEYELSMVAAGDSDSSKVGITSFGFVLLNTVITPELAAEGLARDAIRHIQQARKDADLDVSDRIILKLIADEDSLVALREHQQLIANETLATELSLESGTGELAIGESGQMQIVLAKA